ncbi:VC0807 family protein [Bacillus sp. DTU_2020_1000418_1_SI_GHA_SEK_038]|uniref:VC0807 family protein n=1 Tax=Bacillus sp. DTU_2020_1000418_1_SI_GHA_SEK_038 TaxID=3077585 RepID=UPI0028E7F2BB|nr:VC0807 family protein [Bacillus sp. DTU_2020_1000418_1_SI_GHA_SEK_038]WNS75901.1 VC0807 family protein [Bacillus sp. DTU_2020_1000418_1_SI_GHA_SEK_038]
MKKYIVLLDIIFYVVFPLAVWNLGREWFGDYLAMILSTVPGILYSLYRFFELKKINFFGIYLLTNLIITFLIDVLAGSALQLLWNNVIYSYILGAVFFGTIIVKKPIFLYMALDLTEMQGQDRSVMKSLFFRKKILTIFSWITAGFALKFVILASIKTWLIQQYGVEAFDKGIILRQVLNWGFTIVSLSGFYFINKELGKSSVDNDEEHVQGESPLLK